MLLNAIKRMRWPIALIIGLNVGIAVVLYNANYAAAAAYTLVIVLMLVIVELQHQMIEDLLKDMNEVLALSKQVVEVTNREMSNVRQAIQEAQSRGARSS